MKSLKLIFLSLLLYGMYEPALAEVDKIQFKGFVQTWYSIGLQDTLNDYASGYTLRRVRLKALGNISQNINWYCHYGWDKQAPSLIDVAVNIKLSKYLKIKIGQFVAPGAKSGALTSSSKLDFVERSMIAQKWSSNTALKGYRTSGVQFAGKIVKDKILWTFMIANSHSSRLFSPTVKKYNMRGYKTPAIFGRLEAKPKKCLETGIFITYWKNSDTDDKITSYGGNIFLRKDKIQLKSEYIAGTTETGTDYSGLITMLGYKINKFEPVIRHDIYSPADGKTDKYGVKNYSNITLGVNFYYHKKMKFQANYILRQENKSEIDNNLFYINAQFSI